MGLTIIPESAWIMLSVWPGLSLSMKSEQSRLTSRVDRVCRALLDVIELLCQRHLILLGSPAPRPDQRPARILRPLRQQEPARRLGQKHLCTRTISVSTRVPPPAELLVVVGRPVGAVSRGSLQCRPGLSSASCLCPRASAPATAAAASMKTPRWTGMYQTVLHACLMKEGSMSSM